VATERDRGTEILVIDDEAIMRELMTDWLEGAGYRVLKAADCHAASAALERAPGLVVTDMCMPGPRGVEAIRWIHEKDPGARIIAVSGHFGSGWGCSEDDAVRAGVARALAKPLKRAQLLGAVAELIGPPRKEAAGKRRRAA
jgi:two-component system response regulator FlrC